MPVPNTKHTRANARVNLIESWGGRRVSNPRPPEPQSGVLPLNYAHHTDCQESWNL